MYKRIDHARELPDEWNTLCRKNIYLSKAFLEYMERVNYCRQSYHLFYQDNRLCSCFMMFERRFNLFIFTDKYHIKLPMKFIYLPLSVSEPSIVFGKDSREMEETLKRMKGLKIIINTDASRHLDGFSQGHYLPVCILKNRWESFDEYMKDLRSGYRRRYQKALEKGKALTIETLTDNKDFTKEMYGLYEQVFQHSTYSLEKLTWDFFKNNFSKIICLKLCGTVEAFVQIIEDRENDTLIFEFGGYNYEKAHEYDLYHNMLLVITKYAIEHHFKYIHYGQTAYDAKLKFGADMYDKYFLLSHSNPLINRIIRKHIDFLEYKVPEFSFHVFREDKR